METTRNQFTERSLRVGISITTVAAVLVVVTAVVTTITITVTVTTVVTTITATVPAVATKPIVLSKQVRVSNRVIGSVWIGLLDGL